MAYNKRVCAKEFIDVAVDNRISFTMSFISSVIKNILKYLTAKELGICALVSKVWNDIVTIIKKERHEPFMLRELSASFQKDDTLKPIYDPSIGKRFLHRLKQSWCEPNLAIIVSSREFFFHPFRYFMDMEFSSDCIAIKEDPTAPNFSPEIEQRQSQILANYLKCHLPKDCRFVYFCGWQVMGYEMDQNTYGWYGKGLSGMLLPSVVGISIEPFSITYPEFYFDTLSYKRLKVSGLQDIPSNHNRCYLALFCKEGICILHREILNSLQTRKQDLFIGARIHQSFSSGVPADHYQICAGLSFSGKNIVIKCLKFCASCLKTKLESLKHQEIPDRGIGLMLAKPCNMFAEGDCIPSIFHDFFPKIPILGITLLPNFETVFSNRVFSSFSLENKCLICNRYNNVVIEKLTEEISIILFIFF